MTVIRVRPPSATSRPTPLPQADVRERLRRAGYPAVGHVRCGDDIRGKLAEAGLPGQFQRWADPLCQGPTPAGLAWPAWQAVRAAFIADAYEIAYEDAVTHLAEDVAGLVRAVVAADEVVLWFEHDLFDQIILVQLLDLLPRWRVSPERLKLICIGAHPAVPRFRGLGQLDAAQLGALYPERRPIEPEQLRLAETTWSAFTAPDPTALLGLLRTDLRSLPYLPATLRRHLQEFPATGDGLALSERLALRAVQDGADTGVTIFRHVQDREAAPWMGDTMFFWVLRRLATGAAPLLTLADGRDWPRGAFDPRRDCLRLTEVGERVLAGAADWTALAGIDRWLGGVHLSGSAAWRWDEAAGTVIAA